jgi:hypothetical protein
LDIRDEIQELLDLSDDELLELVGQGESHHGFASSVQNLIQAGRHALIREAALLQSTLCTSASLRSAYEAQRVGVMELAVSISNALVLAYSAKGTPLPLAAVSVLLARSGAESLGALCRPIWHGDE